jgi:GNAT superfamily N-acetyltransferase
VASLTVRPARPQDAALLLELFGGLAEYEHLEHELRATEEQLREALFGERPAAEALIAERPACDDDLWAGDPRDGDPRDGDPREGEHRAGDPIAGDDPRTSDPQAGDSTTTSDLAATAAEPLGYALFFPTFSSFLASTGVWLEDLFVREEHRGEGVGKALLEAVAALVRERGGERLEWAALDWNEPALGFYRRIGASTMNEWITHRLDGEALARVAAQGRR